MDQRTCAACGAALTRKTRGPAGNHCNDSCRVRAWEIANPEKVRAQRERRAAVVKAAKVIPSATCLQCGETYAQTRADRKYCKPICARRAYSAARKADGRIAAERATPKYKAKAAAWQKANAHRYKGKYLVTKVCLVCDKPFTIPTSTTRQLTCSPTCGRATAPRRRGQESRRSRARRLLRNPVRPAPYGVTNRARRRAREVGATITDGSRFRVMERDDWTCQICGDPVDRTATVPALDAPVVDHRVPLAAGGEHCEDNWQCAHFYCNSVKQDTNLDVRAAA